MGYKERYPKLYQFLGSYFHQDWKDDYDWQGETPDFEAVIHHYKMTNPRATVTQAAGELEQLLALPLDEDQLDDAAQRLGSVYNPRARGLTGRQWLERILHILHEPSERARAIRI